MIVSQELEYTHNQLASPEKMSRATNLLVQIAKFGKNKKAIKVLYFEKLLNFIRVLSLYIICKNEFKNTFSDVNFVKQHGEHRIIKSLIDLLFHIDILENKNGKPEFNKKYDKLLSNNKKLLVDLFEQKNIGRQKLNKIFTDFLFVRDLIDKYSHSEYEFRYVKKNKHKWEQMIDDGTLNYEIRLAETLYELSRWKFPEKLKAPFDEDYYTESGRNAFKNFTRYKFIDVFTKIV